MKKMTGTSNAGNISTVLNWRIFSSESPAATIRKPPTIDISTMNAGEKKLADKNFAIRKIKDSQIKMIGVSSNIPQPKPAPNIMAQTRVNIALVYSIVWLPLVAA